MNGLLGAISAKDRRKIAVWVKGYEIPGYLATEWRRDDFGNTIRFRDYGDRSSEFGWEIDHITPVALGGSDGIMNLRPLHYRANASLGGLLSGLGPR